MKRLWARLPATVVALGAVSFFTDLSSEMIYPLLPVFLTTVLGAGALALGVVEGVAESTAAIFKVASGWMTDRTGRRKPYIFAGYGLAGTVRPLIGAVASWPFVVVIRFLDRIGKGIRTSPRDALLADVTSPDIRGQAFGFHRAMDHAGAVLGPLVAAALLAIPGFGLRHVFFSAAIPAVIVMVIIAYAVKDPGQAPPAADDRPRLVEAWRDTGPSFRRLLAALLVFTLGNSSDAFLLLRLSAVGVGATGIAVLWSIHHVIKMGANLVGGRLSDRWGRKWLIVTGWLLYAVVYAGMGIANSSADVIALFLAYGVFFGLTEPVERAWVSEMAPARVRGSAFGLYNATIGLGALPASLIFGAIYAAIGPHVAFATGAALAAVAAVMLARLRPGPQPSTV